MTYRYLLKDIKAYGSMFASHKKTTEDGWGARGHGGTRAAQKNLQILTTYRNNALPAGINSA